MTPTESHPAQARPGRGDACAVLRPDTVSATPPARRLASEALLAGAREIEIAHGESVYRLRLTSLGKLILTK